MTHPNESITIVVKYVDQNGKTKAEHVIKNKTPEDYELKKAKTFDDLLDEIHMKGSCGSQIASISIIEKCADDVLDASIVLR